MKEHFRSSEKFQKRRIVPGVLTTGILIGYGFYEAQGPAAGVVGFTLGSIGHGVIIYRRELLDHWKTKKRNPTPRDRGTQL